MSTSIEITGTPLKPYIDAREFVGYTKTTSDRSAQLARALKRASEHEMGIMHPPWQVTISEPMRPESFVEWIGTYGRSGLKVGAGSNCAAIKSPRYGEGGTTGGTTRTSIRNLEVDGNFAENGSTTDPCVALDGIRPVVDQLFVKNGVVNFLSKMSRTPDASGGTLEDGILTRLALYNPQQQNLLAEGPHDTVIQHVNARSNVEGFPNIVVKGGSIILSYAHPYGNAQYACELDGDAHSCVFEGGRLGQLLIPTTGHRVWDSFLFNGGGADGKIGVVIGANEASQAFSNQFFNLRMEGLINGLFKYNTSENSGLVATGYATAASGEAIVGPKTRNVDNDFRQLMVNGGMTDNSKVYVRASAGSFFVGRNEILEVTGTSEINTLQGGETGQRLTLWFKETASVAVTGNIRLAGNAKFSGTANDTLTLILKDDGNWYETGRAVI